MTSATTLLEQLDDMDRLYRTSAFKRDCTSIRFEEQGVNLFAACVKS